jgi:hypothetical protein
MKKKLPSSYKFGHWNSRAGFETHGYVKISMEIETVIVLAYMILSILEGN